MARDTYPPVANVARFKLLANANDGVDDHQIENSLYVRNQAGWGAGEVSAFAGDVLDAWITHMLPVLSIEYTLTGIVAKDLSDVDNIPIQGAASNPGQIAGESAPYSACAVARLPGTVAQAPKYGYLRVGPLGESQLRGNHLTTAANTAIQTAVRGLVTELNAVDANTDVVVVSVLLPKASNPVPPAVFRDAGSVNVVGLAIVRRQIGRSVSRLD